MSSSPDTDPKQACLDFFAGFHPLSETTRSFLEERLVVHELNKDTRLFSGDQVLEDLYYIHRGLLRHYYFNKEGRETTGWFAAETEILYFPGRYREQISTQGSVELLEKATLVSLRYDELDELYELDPTTNAIGRRISEHQLRYFLKRESLFRSRISKERYLCFLEYFPHLFGRVQNRHVASYLEISPGTISRALSGTSSKEKDTEIKKTDSRPEKKKK